MDKQKKCIFIGAGGTGGHIFPALNLAEEILKLDNINIMFVTDQRFSKAFEEKYKHLQCSSFAIKKLSIIALNKSKPFSFAYKVLLSLAQTTFYTIKYRPQTIIGFGGYASFPTLLICALFRRNIYLHEQNAVIGRINKLFLPFCKKIITSFQNTTGIAAKYTQKTAYLGLPLSSNFYKASDNSIANTIKSVDYFTILITGGSQGAVFFGKQLAQTIVDIATTHPNIQFAVFHQSTSDLQTLYANHSNITSDVQPFFQNIENIMLQSDLLISRGGASSVHEAIASGVETIFVPLPSAIYNHQELNVLAIMQNYNNRCHHVKQMDRSYVTIGKIISDAIINGQHKINQPINKNSRSPCREIIKLISI